MDYILIEALVYKVSDKGLGNTVLIKYETILEFIKQLSNPIMGRYIRNVSNMYVLVGTYDSQNRLDAGEKRWNEILTADESLFIESNGELILGCMLMENVETSYHTIDYIWTRDSLRCKGLARRLIDKYEQVVNYIPEMEIHAIPGEVASPFWKRYFTDVFGIYTLEDLEVFKDRVGLNVQWDLLEARYKYADNGDLESDEDSDEDSESEAEAEYRLVL